MSNVPVYRSPKNCIQATAQHPGALYHGDTRDLIGAMPDESIDMVFSSPPYCIGKQYESARSIEDFRSMHSELIPELVRILRPGGSFCWQVGSHVTNGVVTPLDYLVFAEMLRFPDMRLRNRVIWSFGHGLHCSNRFSGRHEVVLWFTKGDKYRFNLDAVRVPQKYPGKRHSRGPKKGAPSGNPRGKNPSDVWDIPNVKANHVEKTAHPCQFPVALPQMFTRALTNTGDLIFDPFSGSGTTGVAALIEQRRFVGAEIDSDYIEIARERMSGAINGTVAVRPWDKAIHVPDKNTKVATPPDEFITIQGLDIQQHTGLRSL